MANYEYIIASLPDVTREWKFADGESQADFIGWIKSQLTSKDIKTVDTLLAGGKEENLTKEFYQEALKDGNRFIREYFAFDLGFRNVKARFVNKVFGRPLSQDTIDINPGEEIDTARIEDTLSQTDILARERGLDSIRWEKISSLTTFSYFDLDAILGVIAKMGIVERWRALDEETGREMFQELIDETRASYGGVSYNPAQNE